jgi:hypothetical protein
MLFSFCGGLKYGNEVFLQLIRFYNLSVSTLGLIDLSVDGNIRSVYDIFSEMICFARVFNISKFW